jgi:hypothetical protein
MRSSTDIMFFIPIAAIPEDQKAMYLCIIAAFGPKKSNPCCARFTGGGNHTDYNGTLSTKSANLSTIKTWQAQFMTWDLKDFYLAHPHLDHPGIQHDPIRPPCPTHSP